MSDEREHIPIEKQESPEDPLLDFGDLKKKKKKSKKVIVDDENVQEIDDESSETKKKSTKKESAEGDDVPEDVDPNDMFGGLKKKKKKKSEKDETAETPDDSFSGEKKKKKKKKETSGAGTPAEEASEADLARGDASKEGAVPTEGDYTYTELLARVFRLIREVNPELAGDKKRYTIVPPQVLREGSKKTAFANIIDICKRMNRQPDHVIQFLFAELGTSGSIDGNQRLIIKGRFQQKQIENVLKKYIVEYVTCKTCRSGETALKKENRLYFLQCGSCGSSRSVSAIKTGFLAQTGKRSAQKAAAG